MKRQILTVLGILLLHVSYAQDENVLIGLNSALGIKIKANFPGYTGSWARGYHLTNQDASQNFFGIGVVGNADNGMSGISYGWIGKDYSNVYMAFLPSGNVGIGTISPEGNLEVKSGINSGNPTFVMRNWNNVITQKAGSNVSTGAGFLSLFTNSASENVVINASGSSYLNGGNVGIGTVAPNEKLSVNGKIRAHEIKVETANWPDYVFEEGYALKGLEKLEGFIKANKHLPEMPSAKEVEKDGISLGEMNAKLLKKIEELTLHLIDQHKRLNAQELEINRLKSRKL